jgi:hypothetical protein
MQWRWSTFEAANFVTDPCVRIPLFWDMTQRQQVNDATIRRLEAIKFLRNVGIWLSVWCSLIPQKNRSPCYTAVAICIILKYYDIMGFIFNHGISNFIWR